MQSLSLVVRLLLLVVAFALLPSSVGRSGMTRTSLCASESGTCQFEAKSSCLLDGELRFNYYTD